MNISESTPYTPEEPPQGRIYSVSELTREIRMLLEDHFPFLWVQLQGAFIGALLLRT